MKNIYFSKIQILKFILSVLSQFVVLFVAFLIASSSTAKAQNDNLDVLKYVLKIKNIDFTKKVIRAEAQIYFKLRNQKENKINLSLLAFQINNIKLNGQNSAYKYDGSKISVSIPLEFMKMDTLNIDISYQGKPKQDSTWGGFFIEQDQAFNYGIGMSAKPPVFGRSWFPSHDNYTDHALYRFELTCAKNKIGVANGTLEQIVENDTTHTFIWELHDSIPNYLASISIGTFDVYKDEYRRKKDSLPIEIFVPKGMKKQTAFVFRHLKDALRTYEKLWGFYEWERIGYVSTPFKDGAMEHATNIAYSSYCNSKDCESTLYHELSHHWFGDLVTCAGEKDMWLNEAWASYCEYLFYENVYSFERAQKHLARLIAVELRYAPISDGSYIALNKPTHNLTYGTNIYKKGAMTVHTLRNIMGDSLFFSSVRAYLHYYKYRNTTIKQFQAFIEQFSSMDLSDYFNNWINITGFPDYYISKWKKSKLTHKFKIEVEINQNLLQRNNYANNQAIEILFANSSQHKIVRIFVDGRSYTSTFLLNFEPEIVVLDPRNKVCDAQFTFYKKIIDSSKYKFRYGSMTVQVQNLKDNIDFYSTFHYTSPDNSEISIKSVPFFWDIAILNPHKEPVKAWFEILDSQNHPNLYFRKDDYSKWLKLSNTSEVSGKFELRNLKSGQYTFGN